MTVVLRAGLAMPLSMLMHCGPPSEPPMQPTGRETAPPRQPTASVADAGVEEARETENPGEPEPAHHDDAGDGGAVVHHRGLNPEQIRSVVLAHRGALYACYKLEAQKDPSLRGGVTVVWKVDPGGAVTVANLVDSTIHNEHVEGCIMYQVRSWHFPRSDGVSQATFPFSFGSRR